MMTPRTGVQMAKCVELLSDKSNLGSHSVTSRIMQGVDLPMLRSLRRTCSSVGCKEDTKTFVDVDALSISIL